MKRHLKFPARTLQTTLAFVAALSLSECGDEVVFYPGRENFPESANPMLVTIDTGGQPTGVEAGYVLGVFVQYNTGGQWIIQWTCDILQSGYECPWAITVSAPTVANLASASTITPTTTVGATSTTISVSSTQENDLESITFQTAPGAQITVTAVLGGSYDPSNFYFIQGGVEQGGGTPLLTDPLLFVGSTP